MTQCTHYECRCARARELAEMGLIAEAVEVHQQRVTCRKQKDAKGVSDG
jgi:hypothetical protein